MNKSVWDLKQFVVADELDGVPVPAVQADYGFFNCQNEEEEVELKEAGCKCTRTWSYTT